MRLIIHKLKKKPEEIKKFPYKICPRNFIIKSKKDFDSFYSNKNMRDLLFLCTMKQNKYRINYEVFHSIALQKSSSAN